jgi:hypothetical protein
MYQQLTFNGAISVRYEGLAFRRGLTATSAPSALYISAYAGHALDYVTFCAASDFLSMHIMEEQDATPLPPVRCTARFASSV